MSYKDQYEPVIGLEVHARLLTESKLFCGDSARFGDLPNSNISAISLAHPGTLPFLNEAAVDLAIRLGLAFGCDITRLNYFDRKNYFYPDLPKGYQVTQQATPICKNGFVGINVSGMDRTVALNRIHLEEDAGKSVHDADEHYTCVDLNRAGVPLVEIVSEPDIYSSDEAFAYLTEIRKMVRFLEVCDGNMEEGSLRCDANISLRIKGEKKLGTRVEVKNLNSIRNVKKAIDFEIDRLSEILESGKEVEQQTRSFDAATGTTFALRSKEEANDYRYFPEPDLPPFFVTDQKLASIQDAMPELPAALSERLSAQYDLSTESLKVIGEDRQVADFFETVTRICSNPVAVANWIIGPIKFHSNEQGKDISQLGISPENLGALIGMVEKGDVSFGNASAAIFPELLKYPAKTPLLVAKEKNLLQEQNDDALGAWIDEVLASMPEKVSEYKKGKKNLIGLFAGAVRKKSSNKADMAIVNKLLNQKLNQS